MANLKEHVENMPLKHLRQQLNYEFNDAKSVEDKLKLLLVMINIAENSQMVLDSIVTDGFLTELQTRIDKLHEKFNVQHDLLKLEAEQDNAVLDALEGSNTELQTLQNEIADRLARMQVLLKEMINTRNNMSLPERELIKNDSNNHAGI
jgi:DNA repair exonuclease SbcCD ATPase subunit